MVCVKWALIILFDVCPIKQVHWLHKSLTLWLTLSTLLYKENSSSLGTMTVGWKLLQQSFLSIDFQSIPIIINVKWPVNGAFKSCTNLSTCMKKEYFTRRTACWDEWLIKCKKITASKAQILMYCLFIAIKEWFIINHAAIVTPIIVASV